MEALVYVFTKRRQMLQAMYELGHDDAEEIEPKHSPLGTRSDPYILRTKTRRPIARWYIETTQHGCRVRLTATEPFRRKLREVALRDGMDALN